MLPDVAMLLQPMWHMHCMWQALLAHFLLESNCELFIACELCDVHTSDSRKAHWTKAQDMLFEPRLKKSSCSCKQSCPHKIMLLTLISFFLPLCWLQTNTMLTYCVPIAQPKDYPQSRWALPMVNCLGEHYNPQSYSTLLIHYSTTLLGR